MKNFGITLIGGNYATSGRQRVLCILTSFRVMHASESWSKHFFGAIFNLFCSFQTFFSDFLLEINCLFHTRYISHVLSVFHTQS